MIWTKIRDSAVSTMSLAGFALSKAEYDDQMFGNWVFEFRRASTGGTIRFINDRGQMLVDGSDPVAGRIGAALELTPAKTLPARLPGVLSLLRELA